MARVVVVAHRPELQSLMAHVLEQAGHEVELAQNAAGALALLREEPADLLVLDGDQARPPVSQVARMLRREDPEVRILTTSADPDALRGDAPGRATEDLIGRPFEIEAFRIAVEGVLVGPVLEDAPSGDVPAIFPDARAPIPEASVVEIAQRIERLRAGWTELLHRWVWKGQDVEALCLQAAELVRLADAGGRGRIADSASTVLEQLVPHTLAHSFPTPGESSAMKRTLLELRRSLGPVVLAVSAVETLRGAVAGVLEESGCAVLAAEDPTTTLAQVLRIDPDVVAIDLALDDAHGLCSRILGISRFATTPVVFLSERADEEVRRAAFAAGAAGCIPGPIGEPLVDAVRTNLKTRELWRSLALRRSDILRARSAAAAAEPGQPETAPPAGPEIDRELGWDAAGYRRFLAYLADALELPDPIRDRWLPTPADELYDAAAGVGATETVVAEALARFLDRPYEPTIPVDRIVLGVLPTPVCVEQRIVAIETEPGVRGFALSNPFGEVAAAVLETHRDQHGELPIWIVPPVAISRLAPAIEAPAADPTDETRAFARAVVVLKWGDQIEVGELLEVSPGGLFVAIESPPPLETRVELHFALRRRESSGRRVLEATVRGHGVRESGEGRTGASFGLENLDPADQEALERYVGEQTVRTVLVGESRQQVVPGFEATERYEILALLGRGATSEVYEALDRDLDEHVALKILRADLSSNPEVRKRLQRELRLARKIRSPRVVQLYDMSLTGERAHLAMELVQGEPLSERLEREPLPVEAALDLSLDALEGIGEAHKLGIVHRDIKPSNLMVTPEGRCKVMDFGLAFATDESHITDPGTVLGTPCYMSPETIFNAQIEPAGRPLLLRLHPVPRRHRASPLHQPQRRRDDAHARPRRDPLGPGAEPRRARGPRRADPAVHGQESGGPLRRRGRAHGRDPGDPGRPRGTVHGSGPGPGGHGDPRPGARPARRGRAPGSGPPRGAGRGRVRGDRARPGRGLRGDRGRARAAAHGRHRRGPGPPALRRIDAHTHRHRVGARRLGEPGQPRRGRDGDLRALQRRSAGRAPPVDGPRLPLISAGRAGPGSARSARARRAW